MMTLFPDCCLCNGEFPYGSWFEATLGATSNMFRMMSRIALLVSPNLYVASIFCHHIHSKDSVSFETRSREESDRTSFHRLADRTRETSPSLCRGSSLSSAISPSHFLVILHWSRVVKDSLQGVEATESMVGTTQTAVNNLRRRKNNNNTLVELRKYELFRPRGNGQRRLSIVSPKVSESNQSEVAVYSEILWWRYRWRDKQIGM